MSGKPTFSREEVATLREEARRGTPLVCPRCGERLLDHPVPRPPDVSYVRRRTWYLCPECGRSVVVDR